MSTQVYTFKITYSGCEDKIWRIAEVSSNYHLSDLGYMILASFDTLAYHMFEFAYKDKMYVLDDFEMWEEFRGAASYNSMFSAKLSKLHLQVGDKIIMTYDLGCMQQFEIELIDIADMPKGQGRAYPKIIEGAGRGIIEDIPADELLELIHRIDTDGVSGFVYETNHEHQEWDYRNYDMKIDNALLKGRIQSIRDDYEEIDYDD